MPMFQYGFPNFVDFQQAEIRELLYCQEELYNLFKSLLPATTINTTQYNLILQFLYKTSSEFYLFFEQTKCSISLDKLQLTGQNLGKVLNSRSGCARAVHLFCYEVKQTDLKLKLGPNNFQVMSHQKSSSQRYLLWVMSGHINRSSLSC